MVLFETMSQKGIITLHKAMCLQGNLLATGNAIPTLSAPIEEEGELDHIYSHYCKNCVDEASCSELEKQRIHNLLGSRKG